LHNVRWQDNCDELEGHGRGRYIHILKSRAEFASEIKNDKITEEYTSRGRQRNKKKRKGRMKIHPTQKTNKTDIKIEEGTNRRAPY
jgi:DNA invertase Pin-like site-specific DNA recombinase